MAGRCVYFDDLGHHFSFIFDVSLMVAATVIQTAFCRCSLESGRQDILALRVTPEAFVQFLWSVSVQHSQLLQPHSLSLRYFSRRAKSTNILPTTNHHPTHHLHSCLSYCSPPFTSSAISTAQLTDLRVIKLFR